jgi:hypothetical protein
VRRLLMLVLFALVLAGGAVVTWKAMGQAKLVEGDLTTARALLARAGGFQSGELGQRLRLIDQARAHTTSAQQRLRRAPLRQLGVIPVVGRDVRVAQAVAASATRTARATRQVVTALQPVQTRPPTQASIQRAADALLALHGTLDDGLERVRAALLRYGDPGHVGAATSAWDQIVKASSSNATATRRVAGSSAASS